MSGATDWLADPPLLADGPPACALCGADTPGGRAPVALNALEPARVAAVHAAERRAGAQLLRTNTRQATALELARHGLADRCEALNNAGSALVRQAAPDAFMLGSVTPIPSGRQGVPPVAERERAYAEQLIYLSDTGVDVLLLEHFADPDEAALAIRVAAGVSDAPVLALISPRPDGRAPGGLPLREAGERLLAAGAQALGLGCTGVRPAGLRALAALGVPLAAFPAPPRHRRGSPAAYAGALAELVDVGALIVGGCCGAGPRHTAAAAKRLGRAPGGVAAPGITPPGE